MSKFYLMLMLIFSVSICKSIDFHLDDYDTLLNQQQTYVAPEDTIKFTIDTIKLTIDTAQYKKASFGCHIESNLLRSYFGLGFDYFSEKYILSLMCAMGGDFGHYETYSFSTKVSESWGDKKLEKKESHIDFSICAGPKINNYYFYIGPMISRSHHFQVFHDESEILSESGYYEVDLDDNRTIIGGQIGYQYITQKQWLKNNVFFGIGAGYCEQPFAKILIGIGYMK